MAISINYQPAAGTIGGMGQLAGQASYMQNLADRITQQRQFDAQLQQQRDMAMFEAAMRERQMQQQAAIQQQQAQAQVYQQAALDQQRMPYRMAEVAFEQAAQTQRARDQIAAQTAAETERMRQEFALRDRLDERSGGRQVDIERQKLDFGLQEIEARQKGALDLARLQGQAKVDYDIAHPGLVGGRQLAVEGARQEGRLAMVSEQAKNAFARDQAAQEANRLRVQEQIRARTELQQRRLEAASVDQLMPWLANPLGQSQEAFAKELAQGWQFAPEDQVKRRQLAGEIGALQSRVTQNGAFDKPTRAALVTKLNELNTIAPRPVENTQEQFEKNVVSVQGVDGRETRYYKDIQGRLHPLAVPSAPQFQAAPNGALLYSTNGTDWRPISQGGTGEGGGGGIDAKTLGEWIKLKKIVNDEAFDEPDPVRKKQIQDDYKPLLDQLQQAAMGKPQAGGPPGAAGPGAAGQAGPGTPPAGPKPVPLIDIGPQMEPAPTPDGSVMQKPKAGSELAGYFAQPEMFWGKVREQQTSPSVNFDWVRVTNENQGSETVKPFPAPLGMPASTITRDAMASPFGRLAVGTSREFHQAVMPQAENIIDSFDGLQGNARQQAIEYLMNVQNVLKQPYDMGFGKSLSSTNQPVKWLQLQGRINKLLEQEIEAVRQRMADERALRRKDTPSGRTK